VPLLPCGLPSLIDHSAVVAGEYNKRVFRETLFFQRPQDFTDNPIEFVNKISVSPALARAFKRWMRREGMMDVGGR